jgi:hypothetical protein
MQDLSINIQIHILLTHTTHNIQILDNILHITAKFIGVAHLQLCLPGVEEVMGSLLQAFLSNQVKEYFKLALGTTQLAQLW